jgi:predicted nucleotidyltransferase/HEPN domain-containing protein
LKESERAMNSEAIHGALEKIRQALIERFGVNLKCLILYGSWAKGTARANSDIDFLVVLQEVDAEVRKFIQHLSYVDGREITIVTSSVEEFHKEKIPLYTAIKREGKIIWGDVDRSIHPDPPEVKYSEFFKKSEEFEGRKIEMAEKLLEENFFSGIPEICFVTVKHVLQAALAMKGEGYSSKVRVLLPLVQRYFGQENAQAFRKLSDLYVQSEYTFESISREVALEAIGCARQILNLYGRWRL